MADFGFMRSGFADAPVNVPEDFANRLMSITLTMVTRAAVDAATYCEHAGRSDVSEEDIAASLKRQAMHFSTDEGLEEDVAETQRILFEDEEDEDDKEDDETEGSYDEEDEWFEENEDEGSGRIPWTRSTCTCDVCRTMNEALDTWDGWTPEDPVEQYLKQTIERSIESANERLNNACDEDGE